MTSYQPGDLVLIAFPYTGSTQTKTRPALVVLDAGNADVVVARVTTHVYRTVHDIILRHWKAAELLAPSVVRTHKLATIEKVLVRRILGGLHQVDRD
jgi:mRNA interferase MazF